MIEVRLRHQFAQRAHGATPWGQLKSQLTDLEQSEKSRGCCRCTGRHGNNRGHQNRPFFGCDLAVKKGFPLYCTFDDAERIAAFAEQGYECKGGLSDLLSVADVVIDCALERWVQVILQNTKPLVSNIFSKAEKARLTGLSYTSCANHGANLNAEGTRVVSCNTTGLPDLGASLRALWLIEG